jgi:hypothetical protein
MLLNDLDFRMMYPREKWRRVERESKTIHSSSNRGINALSSSSLRADPHLLLEIFLPAKKGE